MKPKKGKSKKGKSKGKGGKKKNGPTVIDGISTEEMSKEQVGWLAEKSTNSLKIVDK